MKYLLFVFCVLDIALCSAQNLHLENQSTKAAEGDSIENRCDLKMANAWVLASSPHNLLNLNLAKITWYTIDQLFYEDSLSLINDPNLRSSFYVNEIFEQDLFPEHRNEKQVRLVTMDISYYPDEKGSNNYDIYPTISSAGIDSIGKLKSPQSRWGGIMRTINLEDSPEVNHYLYLDFWMMDPFIEDSANEGGLLYFNYGNISEDVINLGEIDKELSDNGLDNYNDNSERSVYKSYLDTIKKIFGSNSVAYSKAYIDPSNDNYHYFRGTDYDQQQLGILDRYKYYKNYQGNSTPSSENYNTIGAILPDSEDINNNETLDTIESYYQYKIPVSSDNLAVGINNITEVRTVTSTFPNGKTDSVRWFHYKIPINQPDTIVGYSFSGTKRCIRLFLRNFRNTTHFRFATFELTFKTKRINNSITIFPNPSEGKFTVDFNDITPKTIKIYDIWGRVFLEDEIAIYNDKKLNLDLSRFGNGTFLLEINSDNGTVIKKIIIIK